MGAGPAPAPSRLLVRAPNHLGDGIMALPAIGALVAAWPEVFIASPPWGEVIYRGLPARLVAPRDVPLALDAAVLMAPSFGAAWRVRRVPVRVGLDTDSRGWLLTTAIPPGFGHRREDYRRLAQALGALEVPETPRLTALPDELDRWRHLPLHVGLNPVSRSGPPVCWGGFGELGRALGERGLSVRVYSGPGEEPAARAMVPAGEHLTTLPLPDLMGALSRCGLLVSNDSGVAHLAAALGVPVVVIHGSTAPGITGAAGARAVEALSLPCRPCYAKSCHFGVPCLRDVTVEHVLEEVLGAMGGGLSEPVRIGGA